ncbi:MAG: hypothetical protein KME21_00620 [Desmonostoc vinosum HA7617-LM4]|jgi:hypothetical protein|nr:hypothetical protein [Desmonostoc vinosum HA7617-LM4]
MKLDSEKPGFALAQTKQNLDLLSQFYTKQLAQSFPPADWVKLLELPSPFSFDEALLLCPVSADKWLAWIPDHGEVILHTREFM